MTKRKLGRPPRATASEKALEGVDIGAVNPRTVLMTIAADKSAPATARVAACRALLADSGAGNSDNAAAHDAVTELALKLLKGTKP